MAKFVSFAVFLFLCYSLHSAFAEDTENNEESTTISENETENELTSSTTESSQLFGTGSELLDAIMNCPCQQEDLDAVGMTGVKLPGRGNEIGERAGTRIGKGIRRILSAPGRSAARAVPIISRTVETVSGLAERAGNSAKSLAERFPKDIDKSTGSRSLPSRLAGSARLVAGGLLETASNFITTVGRTGETVSSILPFVSDGAVSVSDAFIRINRAVFDWITGIQEIFADGLNQAGRAKGGFVGNVVEGGTGFKTGVFSGITKALGDEDNDNE